jgi:hypothetical protein
LNFNVVKLKSGIRRVVYNLEEVNSSNINEW